MFGRLQREDESFFSYVNSVKDAAVVLQLPVSENEIVSNVVEGLIPAQRSRFVFQLPADNLGALDRLCVYDQNIFFSDKLRSKDTVPSSSVPPVQSTSNSHPPPLLPAFLLRMHVIVNRELTYVFIVRRQDTSRTVLSGGHLLANTKLLHTAPEIH
jgi:hypothetical protein